jgi:hypothetical protein
MQGYNYAHVHSHYLRMARIVARLQLGGAWRITAGLFIRIRAHDPRALAQREASPATGRLFSASSAEPNQVGTAVDVSGTDRAPLGFGPRKFRRSDATSLPSGSTWPCSLDRATVWPSACSRWRASEIPQGGSSGVLAELPIELLQEMRLDGLRSPKAAPRRAK